MANVRFKIEGKVGKGINVHGCSSSKKSLLEGLLPFMKPNVEKACRKLGSPRCSSCCGQSRWMPSFAALVRYAIELLPGVLHCNLICFDLARPRRSRTAIV